MSPEEQRIAALREALARISTEAGSFLVHQPHIVRLAEQALKADAEAAQK